MVVCFIGRVSDYESSVPGFKPHWHLIMSMSKIHQFPLVVVNTQEVLGEHGGLVVEHQIPNREVLGSIPTDGTVLCPCARHVNSLEYWLKHRKWWLCLVMTGKLLTERVYLSTNKIRKCWLCPGMTWMLSINRNK